MLCFFIIFISKSIRKGMATITNDVSNVLKPSLVQLLTKKHRYHALSICTVRNAHLLYTVQAWYYFQWPLASVLECKFATSKQDHIENSRFRIQDIFEWNYFWDFLNKVLSQKVEVLINNYAGINVITE